VDFSEYLVIKALISSDKPILRNNIRYIISWESFIIGYIIPDEFEPKMSKSNHRKSLNITRAQTLKKREAGAKEVKIAPAVDAVMSGREVQADANSSHLERMKVNNLRNQEAEIERKRIEDIKHDKRIWSDDLKAAKMLGITPPKNHPVLLLFKRSNIRV
jgi:hypothetical protein